MKMQFILAFATFGLSACQMDVTDATVTLASSGQIATQSDMAAITGKSLTFAENQSFVAHSNGTLVGDWDGIALRGTYEMRDGFFCRVLTQGPRGPSPEDCQLLILNGDQLHVTRDRGNGAAFSYTVS